MNELPEIEWRTTSLIRVAGYGLLLLAAFDYVNIFIPSRFTNPVWEFQMMAELIEKSPVPLIGLVFVFYGKDEFRREIENIFLRILSWFCLVVAILYIVLIPLGVNNTIRINNLNNSQINNQLSQQLGQLQQVTTRLNEASSQQNIANLYNAITRQNLPPNINNPEELKKRLLSEVEATRNRVQMEAETTRKNQKINLLKNSVKWNLGAIICGVLFMMVWRITNWAR
ncbi:MAG TPA: HpsJ family protein [Leptolyngbyaceae cyanobacterium]